MSQQELSLNDRHHWIFDMDGTLTVAIHDFQDIRATLGLPPGEPILEAIDKYPEEEARLIHQRLDALEFEIAYQATIQPGAATLLDTLLEQGCKVGILTRNGRQIADATLQAAGLASYFDADSIVSRDCCAAKPLPDGVNLLLQRWHCEASDTVMVGDYLYDLKAGADAGVATVHIDVNGDFNWPELMTAGVSHLDELSALIRQ